MKRMLVLLCLGASESPRPEPALDVPSGFTQTMLAGGMQRPVALAWLSGSRLLIGEQYTGRIRMYKNGALQAADYVVVSPVNANNQETGLLGLCVGPNDDVYVFATQT